MVYNKYPSSELSNFKGAQSRVFWVILSIDKITVKLKETWK